MNPRELLEELRRIRLVPVVTLPHVRHAGPLGETLHEAGLPVAEITFRTRAAEQGIATLRARHPGLLVGAGTVLDRATVDRAADAGAQFVVAPGFNPDVVDYCREREIPVVPGVNSPTGIEAALAKGLPLVKYFPAEASGGLRLLDAMAAPYGEVAFMPTGGLTPHNLPDYLSRPQVAACGGTWIATAGLLTEGAYEAIGRNARRAVEIAAAATP
ncbi:bifunctional 4-hydroxy-2-oxoglutarate aldolase/2-dehydro-3-deoxy-phosphogluconate aldolase [Wenjunlia tyrosinilytica]|uniref:2-dehydro-3-deoxy-phosphogluconate aldolase n=1 Tax=Wenjunlia tyrosinilytica TaxID=1544741 RepID=A0A917ZTZ4_9ACTN|nr:bifunctional 4-hydroxy-2-oxoglutarate aldolase/2-dehydro-3-deoxy-phosphogluconate aldolase [Wenjunlia tyrosinilytica]GGO91943.1 ketohydroxyglutarate aldolase [Wenjunlia tyrosinilytica]